MPPVRSAIRPIASCALVLLLGCDSQFSGAPMQWKMSVEEYGLSLSSCFSEETASAVRTANTILRLNTNYSLSQPNLPVNTEIGVYLVFGDVLGDREFAFVIPEIRGIIINAHRIPELARSLGARITPNKCAAANSEEKRKIGNLLTLVLLHEVGHIEQLDQGETTTSEPVEWSQVSKLAGKSRNRELNADLFAGQLLRLSWNLLQELHEQLDGGTATSFVSKHRVSVADILRQAEIHDTIFSAGMNVNKRGILGPISSYSHMDTDLRLLIYFTLARTDGSMGDGLFIVADELDRRNADDAFQRLETLSGSTSDPIPPQLSKYKRYVTGLKSPDRNTREGATRALRSEEPLPDELLDLLLDSLNERYGENAAITYVLQSYGRKAVPGLIKALGSANPRIREDAALCLAQMGRSAAAPADEALRRALLDENKYVRIRARTALGLPATELFEDEDLTR